MFLEGPTPPAQPALDPALRGYAGGREQNQGHREARGPQTRECIRITWTLLQQPAGPIPRASDSVALGEGRRGCSYQFLGESHFENHCVRFGSARHSTNSTPNRVKVQHCLDLMSTAWGSGSLCWLVTVMGLRAQAPDSWHHCRGWFLSWFSHMGLPFCPSSWNRPCFLSPLLLSRCPNLD